MSRQNCKNCGEPYNFDNLVTPGRATMKCVACQRQIYVHTGQILAEPSPLQEKAREDIEQVVMVVSHAGADFKSSFPRTCSSVVEKRDASSQSPDHKGWKRFPKSAMPPPAQVEEEVGSDDILNIMDARSDNKTIDAYSLYQIVLIVMFYAFSLFWIGIALYVLLYTMYPLTVCIFFAALMAFLALCSVAVAEILKKLWRNEE